MNPRSVPTLLAAVPVLGMITLPLPASDFIWVANETNYGAGTVSKIQTAPSPGPLGYREVARYPSVTCQSDPVNGSKEGAVFSLPPPSNTCVDGLHGCCSRAESVPGANGMHQPVSLTGNRPSQTAVDARGDAWVANSTLGSLQSSLSKIAGSVADCVDRNGSGNIQTSADINGDGTIDTDCDGNGVADDASTVCGPGRLKEFWGLDDECVLFTVNIGPAGQWARALALAKGSTAAAPADAWVATYQDGRFHRVDGATGAITATVALADQGIVSARPIGAAIDQFGILWAPNLAAEGNCPGGGCLFFLDTNNPTSQGMVQSTIPGGGFYGVAVDGFRSGGELAQQVWLAEFGATGFGAYRYRPSRTAGFSGLLTGKWARGHVTGSGQLTQGRGIAVDNRTPAFVWVALDGGAVARLPADLPDDTTSTFPAATNLFTTNRAGTVGAAITDDLGLWAVNQGSSVVTHFAVDAAGGVLNANNPDQVNLDDKFASPEAFCATPASGQCKPHPLTTSDFSGFGYRNFTLPGVLLFRDGFETGDTVRWSAASSDAGDLTVTTGAAMKSTAFGLRAFVDDPTALYVQDDTPADEPSYRARFYFDPRNFNPGEDQGHFRTRIFIAFEEAPTRRLMAVVLKRQAGQYSLMARARRDDNSQASTAFFPIAAGPHWVEVRWTRASAPGAADGTFELWVDGASKAADTSLQSRVSTVDFVRMGALSLKAGASGVLRFDEFESRRASLIGP
jgi:hypothetical protein